VLASDGRDFSLILRRLPNIQYLLNIQDVSLVRTQMHPFAVELISCGMASIAGGCSAPARRQELLEGMGQLAPLTVEAKLARTPRS